MNNRLFISLHLAQLLNPNTLSCPNVLILTLSSLSVSASCHRLFYPPSYSPLRRLNTHLRTCDKDFIRPRLTTNSNVTRGQYPLGFHGLVRTTGIEPVLPLTCVPVLSHYFSEHSKLYHLVTFSYSGGRRLILKTTATCITELTSPMAMALSVQSNGGS